MQKRHLIRGLSFLIALTLLFFKDASKSSAFLGGDNFKQTTPEKLNLLILIRASHSSSYSYLSDLSYSKNKLKIIQDAIPLALEQRPLPPNVNFGIMAYGHVIDRTDHYGSCSPGNVELVSPFQIGSQNINLDKFLSITGLGEAPTAVALEEAGKVFTDTSSDALNVILLIADGSDTCNQSPEEKARELAKSKNIVIYTIGFMADVKANDVLRGISSQASGEFLFISPFIDDNEVAIDELTSAISSVFDDLLARIYMPVQTATPIPLDVATLSPTSADTQIPTSTPTEIPPQPTPETISTVSIPDEKPPFSPIGLFFVAIVVFLGILGFGFWVWKSQKTTKVLGQTPVTESIIAVDESLEKFKEDLFEAYASIEAKKHYPKFIDLELVKIRLSSKYTHEQFDNLLARARSKYPNEIWIDKDNKEQPQTFIKIIQK